MTSVDVPAGDRSRLPLILAMLVAPRRTTRHILDRQGARGSLPVVVVAMISSALLDVFPLDPDLRTATATAAPWLGGAAPAVVAAMALIGAVLFGVAVYFVLVWCALWGGRLLGGTASFAALRAALAWAYAPLVWALLYRIPAVIFWPEAVLFLQGNKRLLTIGHGSVAIHSLAGAPMGQIVVIGALNLAVGVGGAIVGSRALAEAQGFPSAWRGLGNLVLAYILPLVALLVVVLAGILASRT